MSLEPDNCLSYCMPLTLFTEQSIADDPFIFSGFCFILFSKEKRKENETEIAYYTHIWNEHGKCITMSTNKPMFGPVVLEIVRRFRVVQWRGLTLLVWIHTLEITKPIDTFDICDLTHWKGPVGSEDHNLLFAISWMAVLSAQFWCETFQNQTLGSWDMAMPLRMS